MAPYRIRAADRSRFKRCRRAWDFGAWARQNWEPAAAGGPSPDVALLHALEVYYHPAMWEWPRSVVLPLVHRAVDRAGGGPTVHQRVESYASWAAGRDDFTPMQVGDHLAVTIPDPVLADRDLSTEDGDPVQYVTRIDAVVAGAGYQPWLLTHRISAGPLPDPAVLGVEEKAVTDCWVWEHFYLDARMSGVLFNEVRTDVAAGPEAFRRTALALSRDEVTRAGRQLGYEAFDMLDPGLVAYPSPAPEHCRGCPFLAPCRAVRTGGDPAPLLAAGYRHAEEGSPQEVRLGGGGTWGLIPPGAGRRRGGEAG